MCSSSARSHLTLLWRRKRRCAKYVWLRCGSDDSMCCFFSVCVWWWWWGPRPQIKRVTLLELVDFVSTQRVALTDAVLGEMFEMLAANLFRPLPPRFVCMVLLLAHAVCRMCRLILRVMLGRAGYGGDDEDGNLGVVYIVWALVLVIGDRGAVLAWVG